MKDSLIDAVNSSIPSSIFYVLTPSDTRVIELLPRALYIGGTGDLVVEDLTGNEVTFTVLAGTILPIRPTKLKEATTATNIIGLR